ncbi:major facilitator superfamily transporter [Xylaria nigripes]|nr:major facilitator superfamily transporter [Xylaria nigripes]
MEPPHETTALLHSTQIRDNDIDKALHPSLESDSTDIEANGVPSASDTADPPGISTLLLTKIIAVLMIGFVTFNLDGSLVFATHPRIASEFHALEDSSWIFVGYVLGGIATQVLYAKLSDIYGRTVMLVFCYTLFGVGSAIIGLSRSMEQVIVGRVISGSGGTGLAGLVMVITTDLIPLREVAPWLGYINLISTTARSVGGPLGGFLADQIGWRWSFLGQAPLFAVAIIAVIIVIPNTKAPDSERHKNGFKAWLSSVDLSGSLFLGTGCLVFLIPLQIGGVKVSWTHPLIWGLFATGILLLCFFVLNEARWVREPAFPIRLIKHRDVLSSYVTITCIFGAHISLMYFVPLYFQITTTASNTVVGFHVTPSVVGNAIGGLVAGYFIQRTGSYKYVILGSSTVASIGYMLLLIRWHGDTNMWETMYIALEGFGMGMALPAIFISLNAVVDPMHKAVVASGIQLVMPIGMLLGIAACNAAMVEVLRNVLAARLTEIGLSPESMVEIIKKSLADVEYVRQLPKNLSNIVVGGYVAALRASFGVIFAFSLIGLVASCFLRECSL